jgi:hypothetical protein
MPQSDIFVSIQTLCRNHFRPPDCILGTKDYNKLHHKRPNWEPLLFRLWLLSGYYRGSISMSQSDIFVSIQSLCRNHFRPPDCILSTKDYTKLHHKRPLLFCLWLFINEDRSQCPRVKYIFLNTNYVLESLPTSRMNFKHKTTTKLLCIIFVRTSWEPLLFRLCAAKSEMV